MTISFKRSREASPVTRHFSNQKRTFDGQWVKTNMRLDHSLYASLAPLNVYAALVYMVNSDQEVH
jgi:hypothetical protein